MIAARRTLRVGETASIATPLLLPSFSSKGFPKVRDIMRVTEEYISDEILVSAYDLHYNLVNRDYDFASAIFLDSGGYEASKDTELSEIYEGEYLPRNWTPDLHAAIVSEWTRNVPTIFVSYDGKRSDRVSIADQIQRANNLNIPNSNCSKSLLIKPETRDSVRLDMKRILPAIPDMTGFSVIGVTEKEVGNSFLDRMLNIARLRLKLDATHPSVPIHVFGSLDTISTYLYFLAGADIFDGLTWLRYAFSNGDTLYRQTYGLLNLPATTNSDIVEARSWSNNYQYMQEMRLNMVKFTADNNFAHFGRHEAAIRSAYQSMVAELKGAN